MIDVNSMSPAELQQVTDAIIARRGKSDATAGLIQKKPIQLASIVYWASGASFEPKTFFDGAVNTTVGTNYTLTKTYPGGFSQEYVEITHAKIIPQVAFAILITSGLATDAYNQFLAGTTCKWVVNDTTLFEHNIQLLLPHMSVGVGAGTSTIISYTDQNYIELPEPVRIPKGQNLSIVVTPPTGMTMAADAAATNIHIVKISATVGTFYLQFFGLGTSEASA